jgi:hypothetical protein
MKSVLSSERNTAETVPFPRFSPATVTVSFTLPDDGSTAVTSGEPCAKSNGPSSVSRAAATRSANQHARSPRSE